MNQSYLEWQPEWTLEVIQGLEKEQQLELIAIIGMPIEIYHHPDCPGVSASTIVGCDQSLMHYRVARAKQKGDSLVLGNALHTKVLEPKEFSTRYAEGLTEPKFDKRTKDGKAGYSEWVNNVLLPFEKETAGKIILTSQQMSDVHLMEASINNHDDFKKLLSNSMVEVTYFSRCRSTGILKKCRTDMIAPKLLITCDIKTTTNASRIGFPRAVRSYKYNVKQAYYHDILKDFYGVAFTHLYMAVENIEPYECQLFEIAEADIEVGQQVAKNYLNYYAEAVKLPAKDQGYPKGIQPLIMPAYSYDTESY